MTRSRVVPALVLVVSCVLAASRVDAAYDAFRTMVKFSKAVQLADGSVLPPGPYDVLINFTGVGKTAEFEFILPGGKHVKQPAQAEGFPPAATGGAGSGDQFVKGKMEYKYYEWIKMGERGEYKEVKIDRQNEMKYKLYEGDIKMANQSGLKYLKLKFELPAGRASQESFSWGKAGFGPQTHATTTEERGLIIVVCKSSNSPAFFKAQFPVAKGHK